MRFSLGQLIVTPRAAQWVEEAGTTVDALLERHARGDWGEVTEEQWRLNDESLRQNLNLVSTYDLKHGDRLTIFTKADRSYTLVHLSPSRTTAALSS